MKTGLLFLALVLGSAAHAHVDCAGLTDKNAVVNVTISTGGPLGTAEGGYVSVRTSDNQVSSYPIGSEDIAQFFEDSDQNGVTTIGLSAYQDAKSPVRINFRGTNQPHGDLSQVLRNKAHVAEAGNAMHVWMGPGYKPESQYSFTDVVCSSYYDQN